MAVAAQVLLLVALLCNIHAEVLLEEGQSHRFVFDKPADYCSVSRWAGEERQLLFNSTPLHDFSPVRDAAYEISRLKVSDSGQYQEQCWTRGNLTHERNSTLLVCGTQNMTSHGLTQFVGQTVELTCDGVGPNQSVQWVLTNWNSKTETLELAPVDVDDVSSTYPRLLVKNRSLLITAIRPLPLSFYHCVEKSRQRCDSLSGFRVSIPPEFLLRSLGERLTLNCSDARGNRTHEWWVHRFWRSEGQVSHKSTLVLPTLTLNHTGQYFCHHSDGSYDAYDLSVCPEAEPPAVVLFTGGENLTLQCGDRKQTSGVRWFTRSNRTEGRVLKIYKEDPSDSFHLSNTSLVIPNVSVQDGGEFWCEVREDGLCVFRSESLVMFGEPEVDHPLVRSVLVSAVMVVMCVVVVVAVVCGTRSREQLPAPVEELEMSRLSPASDEQQETAV